jgi:hypothetical protein
VALIQQILAAHGEFEARRWPPAEVGIERVVTGYIETWEPIRVSNIQVVFKMFGKID